TEPALAFGDDDVRVNDAWFGGILCERRRSVQGPVAECEVGVEAVVEGGVEGERLPERGEHRVRRMRAGSVGRRQREHEQGDPTLHDAAVRASTRLPCSLRTSSSRNSPNCPFASPPSAATLICTPMGSRAPSQNSSRPQSNVTPRFEAPSTKK